MLQQSAKTKYDRSLVLLYDLARKTEPRKYDMFKVAQLNTYKHINVAPHFAIFLPGVVCYEKKGIGRTEAQGIDVLREWSV